MVHVEKFQWPLHRQTEAPAGAAQLVRIQQLCASKQLKHHSVRTSLSRLVVMRTLRLEYLTWLVLKLVSIRIGICLHRVVAAAVAAGVRLLLRMELFFRIKYR